MATNPITIRSLDNSIKTNSVIINSASGGAASGIDGSNNDASAVIDQMKQAIVNSISSGLTNNAAIISGAVNGVKSQIISSTAASSATITNSISSVVNQMKQQILSSESTLKTYIASDSDIIKRMMQIQTDNIKGSHDLVNSNISKTLDLMKNQLNKSEGANIDKFKELIESMNEEDEKLPTHLRDGIEGALDAIIGTLGSGFAELLSYIIERADSIDETFRKLNNNEYKDLREFRTDLFGHEISGDLASSIWRLVMFIPMLKDVLGLSSLPTMTRLNELAQIDAKGSHLNSAETIKLFRLGLVDNDFLFRNLAIQGYSKEDILLLLKVAKQSLTINDAQELYRREILTKQEFQQFLFTLDVWDDDWLKYEELSWFQPSVNDVIRFVVRDVYNKEISDMGKIFEGWDNPSYLEAARKAGIKKEDARNFWGAHWELPSPTQAYEMLFRGLIDKAQLESLLKSADYAPAYVSKLVEIAYRTPTRVDTRNMYFDNVIDETELLKLIKEYGYNDKHSNALLEYYKRAKVKRNSSTSKVKKLSINIITDSFNKGIINEIDALNRLKDIGFTDTDARIILQESKIQLEKETSDDYTKEIRARFKRLAETAYRERSISKETAIDYLKEAGLGNDEANAILIIVDEEYNVERKSELIGAYRQNYLDFEITEDEFRTILLDADFTGAEIDKHLKEIKALREVRHKDLTLSDVKKAYGQNIITIEEVLQQLYSMGYSERDTSILLELYFNQSEEVEE